MLEQRFGFGLAHRGSAPAIHTPRRQVEWCRWCGELLQAEFGGWDLLDWAALVAFGVQEAQTNFRARCAGRYDDAAIAVVEDEVSAVGFGEAWCAFDDMTEDDAEQKSSETVPVALPSSVYMN